MKYIVKPGCDLWNKLTDLKAKMIAANKKAGAISKRLGGTKFRGKGHSLAGGLSSFYCEGELPKDIVFISKGDNEYFPKRNKANKELLAEIDALPVVDYSELNNLIKYNYMTHMVGMRILFTPGIAFKVGYILLSFDEEQTKYKPVPGMTEILTSEFNKLWNTKTTKKKK